MFKKMFILIAFFGPAAVNAGTPAPEDPIDPNGKAAIIFWSYVSQKSISINKLKGQKLLATFANQYCGYTTRGHR